MIIAEALILASRFGRPVAVLSTGLLGSILVFFFSVMLSSSSDSSARSIFCFFGRPFLEVAFVLAACCLFIALMLALVLGD